MKIFKVASKLKDFALIQTNMPEADFWIIRKGDENKVGMPTKSFSPENIGIKIQNTDKVLPQYLYYIILNLYNQGYFQSHAKGTLLLKHISVETVKNMPLNNL